MQSAKKEGSVSASFIFLVLIACPFLYSSYYHASTNTRTWSLESDLDAIISPSAQVIFQETFNTYSVGSYPGGWFTHDNRSSGTVFDVSSTVIDSGNSLRIIDNQATDNGWGRIPFSRAIQAGVLEFKVRVQEASTGSTTMQHYIDLQDSTNTTCVSVNMEQNLTGNYWTIGIGTTMNTTHLAEDTTYSIKVMFNKWTFILDWLLIDLYVNNVLFLNDQLAFFRMIDRVYVGSTNPTNQSTWFFDTITVTDSVAGNTIPTISSPPDMTVPPGTGRTIQWTITDSSTINPTYTLYNNGTWAGLGTWSSGVTVTISLPSLAPRQTYNFTIVATDGLNATVQDTVIVRTTENTPPSLSGNTTVTFEHGSDGENIIWTVTDSSVDTTASTYQIRRNGSLVTTGIGWASGDFIRFNTTTMNVGNYNITLTVADGMGNSTSFTTILHIVEDLPPRISHPSDITYNIDKTGNKITWIISDFNMTSGWYAIYKDNVLLSNTTWTGGITTVSINIDGLAQGGHVYEIVASDGRHSSSDSVNINVTNTLLDTMIVVLVVAGAVIVVAAIIAVKRKKKAGGTKVKRKVPKQDTTTPGTPKGKVITCPSCGTPFTLTSDYVKQYAGQSFKCTKCQANIPI
ncbi:MAG: hypothetical protein Q6373_022000 [Candidatus Sigynarchaeota archaeon]